MLPFSGFVLKWARGFRGWAARMEAMRAEAIVKEFGKIRVLLVQAFGESADDKARALRDKRAKERAERRALREQKAAEDVQTEDRGGTQDTGLGMAVGIEDQDDEG